jgi:hypothetical protein
MEIFFYWLAHFYLMKIPPKVPKVVRKLSSEPFLLTVAPALRQPECSHHGPKNYKDTKP